MQNQPARISADEAQGFDIPTPEAGRAEARKRLRHMFRPGELIWLLSERYNSAAGAWDIDILRQGAAGRWVRQRYRFDTQDEVLYFLGESSLTDDQFREARRSGRLFPSADA